MFLRKTLSLADNPQNSTLQEAAVCFSTTFLTRTLLRPETAVSNFGPQQATLSCYVSFLWFLQATPAGTVTEIRL